MGSSWSGSFAHPPENDNRQISFSLTDKWFKDIHSVGNVGNFGFCFIWIQLSEAVLVLPEDKRNVSETMDREMEQVELGSTVSKGHEYRKDKQMGL